LIRFVKAHACGNDFLIVDRDAVADEFKAETAIRLCARNTGIGADGVEYLQTASRGGGRIQLYNADGSMAEISGNGTRCVAAWLAREQSSMSGDWIEIETDAGLRKCQVVEEDGQRFEIATGMGVPVVAAKTVTLASGLAVDGAIVSMGNPQFVTFIEGEEFALSGLSWEVIGREICFHSDFPHQTNVEFVRIIDTNSIEIRIFERGVGATTSSGTGSCAAAAASIALRGASSELSVIAPGGSQRVCWESPTAEIVLTGPAELIATGEAF
jgi:diaminopimelate epimerase